MAEEQGLYEALKSKLANAQQQGSDLVDSSIGAENRKKYDDMALNMAMGSMYKVPLENGLEARVIKNPTVTQASNLAKNSKAGGVRWFGDPDGNLHMWDAYDLTHENVMSHNGVPYDNVNYSGAGWSETPEHAAEVAKRFINSE